MLGNISTHPKERRMSVRDKLVELNIRRAQVLGTIQVPVAK